MQMLLLRIPSSFLGFAYTVFIALLFLSCVSSLVLRWSYQSAEAWNIIIIVLFTDFADEYPFFYYAKQLSSEAGGYGNRVKFCYSSNVQVSDSKSCCWVTK